MPHGGSDAHENEIGGAVPGTAGVSPALRPLDKPLAGRARSQDNAAHVKLIYFLSRLLTPSTFRNATGPKFLLDTFKRMFYSYGRLI